MSVWKSLIVAACLTVTSVSMQAPAQANVPAKWKNCTTVNKRLPHGVGLRHAHDHTSGKPVTSFRHDTKMYRAAMAANKGLDRDKDGIACEKA